MSLILRVLMQVQEFSREVDSRNLTLTCAFNLFTVKTDLLTAVSCEDCILLTQV